MRHRIHPITIISILAVFIVLAFPAMAQETSGGFTGGSIKIGYDNRSCNAALAGSVRYNSSTSCPEYCNGTTWICPNSSGGAPDCTDDSTATCTLDANRANGDPNFTAANISCDVNVLGVTGILGTSVIAPNAFTNAFTDLTSQPISTQITSNAVQITGVHCHSNITISGTSAQFRVCDDAACTGSPSYGTTGEIVNNQYLQLRLTTPSSYNTARTATPDINSASDVWSVTTCDGVPNTFTNAFTDLTDQALGATVASNIVQITGMDCSPTVTINSGASGSPRLRVCADATCSTGPAYVTSSSISNNQYLQLRITASGASSTTRTATPDIAGVNDNWTVTSCDGAPDAYSFTDVTDQPLGTVVNSDIVQVTGFTCSGVSVSVSGAATRKYRVCTDATCSTAPAFVTSGGTINSGEYLQLQVQTSGSYSTASTVTASIGGVTDSWSATTRCDNEPDPYKFADVYGQATSSTATSDIVQITGMGASCLASISISGTGGAQKYRVCTDATCSTGPAWVSSGGTITNNQYLQVEHTTSASNSTITTSVPDISGVTDTWRAVSTGVGCDTTPITYTAGGTQTFSVPANCNALVVETFGAGGGGGATGGGGGGGGSLVMRDSDSLVIGAAGGGGGGGASKGAGGGAYSKCAFITTGTGQNFTAYIGGGGSPGSGNNGGNGGAVSGGAGGTASGFSAPPGGGSTYGGGGGGSSNGFFGSGTGGNSTYGGAGGGGGTFPYGVDGGSSTYGGGGGGTYGNAQGGGTYLNVDCLNAVATNGSAPSGATGGAAANSGPGTGGNNGAAGGAGKVIITPAP